MIGLERGLVDEGVGEVEPGGGTERHSDRDRPVQLDHRRRRELGDGVVERDDPRPVRLLRGRCSSMARGDGGLERVGSHRAAESFGALERRESAADQ